MRHHKQSFLGYAMQWRI